MVHQSLTLLARSRGPDEFWRKRRIFKLSSHFRNRSRNCYSNAIRSVHRSLQFATKGRDPRRDMINEIWRIRIDAACTEHNASTKELKAGLTRCEVLLNHKTLAELGVWEPRTFKSLVKIACAKLKQEGMLMLKNQEKLHVMTRSLPK